jgi:hypothetical protein
MKHYKNPNTGELFAFESDGSQDAHIPEGLVSVTNEEAEAIRRAKSEADFDALSYRQKRAREYPDYRDYLDGVVKGNQAQIDAYIAACNAVKAKYPKPE